MKTYNSFNELFNNSSIHSINNSVDKPPAWKRDEETGKKKKLPNYCICDDATGTPLIDISPFGIKGYFSFYTRFHWYPKYKWFEEHEKSFVENFCKTVNSDKFRFCQSGLTPDGFTVAIPDDIPKKELDSIVAELDKYLNKTLNELRPTEQTEP